MKQGNENLEAVTIEDIENHKLRSVDDLILDYHSLLAFPAIDNVNSFYGNTIQYHFQLKNLLKCYREGGQTIYDVYENKEKWAKLIESTRKRDRGGRSAAANVFECFRINTGSIVMFKATTAKYLYRKYKAKTVLDPTAGWGGRMLGAAALDIPYIGIDTNIEMREAYQGMINLISAATLFEPNVTMIWGNCLDIDFSKMDYNFVLTSPPYVNMVIYEHMIEWQTEESFYKGFLIPLWEKCIESMKPGHICLNISPKMYDDALSHGLKACDWDEDLKQQLGQKMTSKKQDKIYIWQKN